MTMTVETVIAPLRFQVTSQVIETYARAAKDFNPLHFDAQAAIRVGMPDRIAHGMICGGVLSRLLTRALGPDYLTKGFLRIKVIAPVYPEQWVVARAVVRTSKPLVLDTWVENEGGTKVIAAEAGLVGE